jgi:murein DD-endopeptidase MepM/ murein hydrolase activator NlpD
MADGYILLKNSPSSASSGMIVIKHAQGYISIYTGIVPTKNPLFSPVKQGSEIGVTRSFQKHSERNNLHIELYEKEKMIDPLEYLSIAQISANLIPSRYGWKYIDDLKKSGNSTYNLQNLQTIIGFFSIDGE